jgi:undecaprenyl diphosphate synthase
MSETKRELRHIGLILDGNRRWARKRGLPTLHGHKKGYENLKDIVKAAIKTHKISFVSAYIFSTENWNRTKEEVTYLMDLALHVAKNEVKSLHKEGIRVRFIGTKERLSSKLIKAIEDAEALTKNNTVGTVALCFNYGGKNEIIDAANKAIAAGNSTLTPEDIEQNLYAPDIPDVDLVIRTSGEQRTSGFMLWRAAYAELLFTDKYWPDFNLEDLRLAVDSYNQRERRFGE